MMSSEAQEVAGLRLLLQRLWALPALLLPALPVFAQLSSPAPPVLQTRAAIPAVSTRDLRFDRPVKICTSVAPAYGGGCPTGTVTFLDGRGDVIAISHIDGSGKAVAVTKLHFHGKAALIAAYCGNEDFAPSVSDALVLKVN